MEWHVDASLARLPRTRGDRPYILCDSTEEFTKRPGCPVLAGIDPCRFPNVKRKLARAAPYSRG